MTENLEVVTEQACCDVLHIQIQKSLLRTTLNMFVAYDAVRLNVHTNQRRCEELLNFFPPNSLDSNKISNKARIFT